MTIEHPGGHSYEFGCDGGLYIWVVGEIGNPWENTPPGRAHRPFTNGASGHLLAARASNPDTSPADDDQPSRDVIRAAGAHSHLGTMRADEASLIMYRRLHLDLPELKKLSSFVSDAPSNLAASHHLIENRFDSPSILEVASWSPTYCG